MGAISPFLVLCLLIATVLACDGFAVGSPGVGSILRSRHSPLGRAASPQRASTTPLGGKISPRNALLTLRLSGGSACTIKSKISVAGGTLIRFTHDSTATKTPMTAAVFIPPGVEYSSEIPAVYWLSGLTCTDENFSQKVRHSLSGYWAWTYSYSMSLHTQTVTPAPTYCRPGPLHMQPVRRSLSSSLTHLLAGPAWRAKTNRMTLAAEQVGQTTPIASPLSPTPTTNTGTLTRAQRTHTPRILHRCHRRTLVHELSHALLHHVRAPRSD